jgi:hypothetical protein
MSFSEKIMNYDAAPLPVESVLRLDKVSMGYLTGQEVLHDVSLSIDRGGFYFFPVSVVRGNLHCLI